MAHAATTAANTEAKGLLILHLSIFVRDYYTEAAFNLEVQHFTLE
jgi:hypothetical protein